MIINRYDIEKENVGKILVKKLVPNSLLKLRSERIAIKKYKNKFERKYGNGVANILPETVQIETFNRCNGECSFCPVNKHVDTRVPMKMTDNLFCKIIDELHKMQYKGRVALFSNNEPLLDMQLEERAKYAKQALPNAKVYIFTNGSLMTFERFTELIPWLDEMIIDNYNDDLELNENIRPIANACDKDEVLNRKVQIHLRKLTEILDTRGGQSPNNSKKRERSYPCSLPFDQMVIRPDGKVSLCCNDALGKMTLGDVSKEKIVDIWNSDKYAEVRTLVTTNIQNLSLCKYCDSKHSF